MKIITFLLVLPAYFIANGQSIVIHKDLLLQLAKNEGVKTGLHATYDNTLSSIKKHRNKITEAIAVAEAVQEKVYNALTNVSDAIKNIKTIGYISKYVLSTLTNVEMAIKLAAGKPYLVDIVSKDAIVFYERTSTLTAYVSNFILKEDPKQLLKPTDRDKFLYAVYRQVMVLDAFSNNLCENLRKWKIQDAVYHIIPFNHWLNQDEKLVKDILKGWQY